MQNMLVVRGGSVVEMVQQTVAEVGRRFPDGRIVSLSVVHEYGRLTASASNPAVIYVAIVLIDSEEGDKGIGEGE